MGLTPEAEEAIEPDSPLGGVKFSLMRMIP